MERTQKWAGVLGKIPKVSICFIIKNIDPSLTWIISIEKLDFSKIKFHSEMDLTANAVTLLSTSVKAQCYDSFIYNHV